MSVFDVCGLTMEARVDTKVWLVVLVSLVRMPPTASESTNCIERSGYAWGPVPGTCTVELAFNDTETDAINSLRAEYQQYPLKCRFGKHSL